MCLGGMQWAMSNVWMSATHMFESRHTHKMSLGTPAGKLLQSADLAKLEVNVLCPTHERVMSLHERVMSPT